MVVADFQYQYLHMLNINTTDLILWDSDMNSPDVFRSVNIFMMVSAMVVE